MSEPVKVYVLALWIPSAETPCAVFSSLEKSAAYIKSHPATTLRDSDMAQFQGPYEVLLDPE